MAGSRSLQLYHELYTMRYLLHFTNVYFPIAAVIMAVIDAPLLHQLGPQFSVLKYHLFPLFSGSSRLLDATGKGYLLPDICTENYIMNL
jgi:hypothetical protein